MLPLLASIADLDAALQRPVVVLFKHSTACAISSMAMREMERLARERPDIAVQLVDVRAHRTLSDEVADRLGVRHESPQAIVLREGEVAWHGSHYRVTAEQVARVVELDVEV